MTDDQIIESIDRHFGLGLASISTTQFIQHSVTGSCHECEALKASGRADVAVSRG